jgi:AraC-like DNA-binding protein
MLSVRRKRWLLLAASGLLIFASGAIAAGNQAQLSPQEQKVIDHLVSDWGGDYSVTSVDIAMNALKVEQSDETRFRIGNYIKAHPELHEVIRRWGWVTLVLTPDEKLIARALINAEREGKPEPTLAEIAKAVGVSESQAKRGLAMLEGYEILKQDAKAGGAGYRVIPHYIKWEPHLDFVFHGVTLDSGRQFNTN